jgi:hypothetical protein
MNIPPGAWLLLLFGLFDISAGVWAYLGPLEEHGAPRGYRNIGKTWHGRGAVCAALPAGVFFLTLGLAAIVEVDLLRRVFLGLAVIGLITALVFLFRAPRSVHPHWLRDAPQV